MKRLLTVSTLAAALLSSTPAAQDRMTPPSLRVDPFWPSMPDTFFVGPVRGLSIDRQDHVWIVHDPSGITADIRGAAASPPQAECCVPAPQVLEFDAAGKYVQGWNLTGDGYEALQQVHGIFVDHRDNVWISSERQGDNHILKFDRAGKFKLQIGRKGQSQGSNDTANVNRAADMFVWPKTNELFVADGYGNRRVVVFDAETGAYKRHWGAYGKRPADLPLLADKEGLIANPAEFYLPGGPPQPQWLAVHCVRVSKDGFVYVCDRSRNRVQIFRRNGAFVREISIAPDTPVELGFIPGARGAAFGAPSTIGFSQDPEQRYLYLGDNTNAKIWIFRRRDLQLLGSFPTKSRANHYLTVDSRGNIYNSGLQKFVFKGVPSLNERLQRADAKP
jgi:hypothetical protein